MRRKQWMSARDRALRLGKRGTPWPTGFETLDGATRGGLRPGRLVVVGGHPGAGKTTLGVQLARDYAQAGHPVAIFACDEDADGLLTRWGQSAGLTREALEAGDTAACAELAVSLGGVLVVDQDEDEGSTVETVAEALAEMASTSDRCAVYLVDSIQTARTTAQDADGIRERTTQTVTVLKAVAKRYGLIVIATSEMARGAYRGGGEKATHAIASFKESGAIEYGATVALALSTADGVHVDVEMPKNRTGQRIGFALELDCERAVFREVAGDARGTRGDDVAQSLLTRLAALPDGAANQRALIRLATGRKALRESVVRDLVKSGRIVGGRGEPYRVADVVEAAQ